VRCEKPIVTAWIELVSVCDGRTISDLNLSAICPLVHKLTQLECRVHSVVIELLLVDLVLLVLEAEVEPVEDVQNFDCLLEEQSVDCATNHILRQ